MARFILFVVLSILIATSFAHNLKNGKKDSVKLRKHNAIKQAGGAIECSICSWLVGEVQTYVAQNQTENEIVTAIQNDCSIFGPLDGLCKTLVGNAVPDIINYLNQNYPPSQICDLLKLCGSTSTGSSGSSSGNMNKNVNKASHKKQPKGPQGLECTICEYAVTQIDTYLENNNTVEEIEQLLDSDCQIFGPFSGTCVTLVNTYLPEIVNLLEQDYPPDVVCSMLGICGNSSTSGGTSSGTTTPATSSSGNTSSGNASSTAGTSGSSGALRKVKTIRKVGKKLKKARVLRNKIKIASKQRKN